MNVILDGNLILDREMLHDVLAEELHLPERYGRNLDALYDCLTDVREETMITLRNRDALEEHLGSYGHRLMRLLEDVTLDNPNVWLATSEDAPGT